MSSAQHASNEITALLDAVRAGQSDAMASLVERAYVELRALAAGYLRQERADHTLHATDLVHEAYLKLFAGKDLPWEARAHFFGAAARAMRQVLVDYARSRSAQKRGGDWHRTTLSGRDPAFSVAFGDLIALDAALDRLGRLNPRLRQVVEMRFFAGMTDEEIGLALDVTARTVQRDWAKARAWLYMELHP